MRPGLLGPAPCHTGFRVGRVTEKGQQDFCSGGRLVLTPKVPGQVYRLCWPGPGARVRGRALV